MGNFSWITYLAILGTAGAGGLGLLLFWHWLEPRAADDPENLDAGRPEPWMRRRCSGCVNEPMDGQVCPALQAARLRIQVRRLRLIPECWVTGPILKSVR